MKKIYIAMKSICLFIFMISTLSIHAQRNFSTTQIATINSSLLGAEGDLYMDTLLNELYIGLQSGALYKVTSTDDQVFDVSTFDASGLNLSIENDGQPTITIPIISSAVGNDLTFNTNGLYINETDNQNLSLGARIGTNQPVNISGGTGVTIDVADNDNSVTNEGIIGVGAGAANSSRLLSNTSGQNILDIIVGTGLSITETAAANGGTITITNTVANTDNQNLSLGARIGTNQPVNISGGTGVTIDVADNDNNSTNEIQVLSRAGDVVSLSLAGGSFTDDHLGTANQTLSGNRTVTMGANSLTFDATQDVIIQSTGRVGIGTISPNTRLEVDNGSLRLADYGTGGYLDTLISVDPGVHLLAVDAQGDVIETNTYKSAKVFYPPAVVVDVSTIGNNYTIDLYQEYFLRMSSPALSSTTDPIPTYSRNEVQFHLLDYDNSVFNIGVGDLSAGGVLTYDVIAVPTGNCTFLNVVFVVK